MFDVTARQENDEIWKFPILTSPRAGNSATQPKSSVFIVSFKGQHGFIAFLGESKENILQSHVFFWIFHYLSPFSLNESTAARKTSQKKTTHRSEKYVISV